MKLNATLNFESVQALVIGDIILDHYIIGKVNRISPEAPVPVVHVSSENYVLGGSGNVAANLSSLKANASLLGAVGTDNDATHLESLCKNAAIDTQFIRADMPTIRKTRVIGGKQQMLRIDWEERFTQVTESLQALHEALKRNPHVLVLSDYGKGLVSDELAKDTIQYANDTNKPLVIDPKGINWTKYQGGFIVTPNLSELAAVYGSSLPNTDAAVENAGKLIKEQFSLQNLLVTRSECGMTLFTKDEIIHYPSHKVEVFDVSGAGDTVVAVLAAGLAAGLGLPQSVELANRAGGFVVSKFGTYPISIEELKALI